MLKVDVNIEHFERLLATKPDKTNILKDKLKKLDLWLSGSDKPTLKQLGQVAKILNIPFGYFFLDEIPKEIYPIPHYRNEETGNFVPSEELKDTIKILQIRQEWVKDLLLDYGVTNLPYVGSVTTKTDVNETVQSIKKFLKIENLKASNFHNWNEKFHYLIEQTENVGIFVVINGIVGNNTHRKLNIDEFRGFVLNDNIAPFIFINNNDSKSAQIFTLVHEIAHIWLGQSASFEFRDLHPPNHPIEIYCNQVAAELLVPAYEITKLFTSNKDYQNLAYHFKVSQIVVARRLLDLNLISKDEFFNFYNNYTSTEKIKKDSGGDFYNTVPYRLSKRFGEIIYNATVTGKISYRDAFQLTDMKPTTFDKYFKERQR